MLPIKLTDRAHRYSAAALTAGLHLVVSNHGRQPAANRHAPVIRESSENPFLCSYPDGERTDALTKVAGYFLSKGLATDEVIQIALYWNEDQSPPLDEDKVRSTVESLARTDARNHPERYAEVLTPLFDITEADISLLLKTNPPQRRWLLKDLLPSGIVGMVVAPGGTGKSQLVLQLGVTVATGIPLCELWQAGETGTALLLLAEDDIGEVHRRLHNILVELGPTHSGIATPLRQKLLIKSLTASNNLMTRASRRGNVEATTFVDRLLMTVAGIKDLKLIVIDPASRFRGGDENSADEVTRFVEQLERLRQATGATVLVCHHANKASLGDKNGSMGQAATRGSSAMTDGVRWQLNLSPPTTKEQKSLEPSGRYLRAEVVKSNYGAPVDPEILIRKPGGYLTSARAAGLPVTLADRVLQLVRDEARAGRMHSANGIEKKFGGESGPLKAGKLKVRETVAALVKAGRLRKQGRGHHLAPIASSPPGAAN